MNSTSVSFKFQNMASLKIFTIIKKSIYIFLQLQLFVTRRTTMGMKFVIREFNTLF